MPEMQFRAIEFRATDVAGDSIPCTVSSEEPVERGEYLEVLSHDPIHVDLSRAPLPLIVQHDRHQLNIGVVEQLRIEGRKLRGLARFGSSELAQQIFKDVKAGIVRNLSVGYLLLDPIKEIGRAVHFAWQPYEASVVSVPADTQAGFFRHSLKGHSEMTDITVTENDTVHLSRSQRRASSQGIEAERDRMREIQALARQHDLPHDMVDRAIDDGTGLDAFRAQVLARVKSASMFRPAESPDIGLNSREISRFSLQKAILAQLDPHYAAREAGLEMEASRAMAQKLGREPQGMFVPGEVLRYQQRSLLAGTPSAGGYLVATEHHAESFIDLLRNASHVMTLGATQLGGLVGNVSIPKKSSGSTAYWVGEGGNVTASDLVFGQVPLTPKTVGGLVDYTRKMLLQASPDIENLVRADLAASIATELDRACINGSGVGAEPLGILGTTGVGSVAIGDNGGAIGWDHVLALEESLAVSNADVSTIAYLTTNKVRRQLKGATKVAGDAGAGFVWEKGLDGYGQMNGYRAAATNNCPSNLTKGTGTNLSALILGNWADLVIGQWGGLDILVDQFTHSASGGVRVVALLDVDMALRHVGSFAVIKDAVTQ